MIRDQPVEYPSDVEVSAGLIELMTKILEKDPEKRATMEEIKKDKWLNEGETSLSDLKHEEPVTVTHEEISRAFHTLETVVLTKKFIKKLRSRMSLHNTPIMHDSENKASGFKKYSTSGSGMSDEPETISTDSKEPVKSGFAGLQYQEEEKYDISVEVEQKAPIIENVDELSNKTRDIALQTPQKDESNQEHQVVSEVDKTIIAK